MFIRVVTLVTLAIFRGRFEADFLTTDAQVRSQRSEVRGQRISSHGRGCFQAYQACKASQANVDGLFCNFKAYHPPSLVRFEKRIWANVCRAWHGGTL